MHCVGCLFGCASWMVSSGKWVKLVEGILVFVCLTVKLHLVTGETLRVEILIVDWV